MSELAGHVFETVLGFEDALTPESLAEAARPTLAALGMQHFFLATVRPSGRADPDVVLDGLGFYPEQWLNWYHAGNISRVDPLVRESLSRSSGFFWRDVLQGRRLDSPAREMICRAEAAGLADGFVALSRQSDGSTRIVSMMGDGAPGTDQRVRLSLQVIGQGLIDRFDRLGAFGALDEPA